jgi:transcriptional antiterminator Rof (Rho-off)
MALLATIPAEIGERHVGVARYARERTTNTEVIAVAAAEEARELGDNQYRSATA